MPAPDDITPRDQYAPFHTELDEQCPPNALLSAENVQAVVRGQVAGIMWCSVFRNSPLQNAEAEMIMGMFVTAAVRAGQWIDIRLQSDTRVAGDIPVSSDGEERAAFSFVLEYGRGMQMMVDQGFAVVREEGNGQQWLAPTSTLIAFVSERLKRFGPRKDEARATEE